MARSYGRFTTDIWRDRKFRALSMGAQWAYFMLGTQADITAAGTLPMTTKRWAGYSADGTSDGVSDALNELVEKRFVILDFETEELLVRSFVKWDGGINNDKRRPVVMESAATIASPIIRAVLANELSELGVSDTECDALCDSPTDRQSPFDRVVVSTSVSPPQPSTLLPQPTTRSPVTATKNPRRASRIADNFQPTPDDIAWARTKNITDTAQRAETEKFVLYWRAKSGKDATKLDWSATWKGWLLRAFPNGSPSAGRGAASDKAMGWIDLPTPDQPAIEGRSA